VREGYQVLEDQAELIGSAPGQHIQNSETMSVCVQMFDRRDDETDHAPKRAAIKKSAKARSRRQLGNGWQQALLGSHVGTIGSSVRASV
jgi:hypothetical protein